MFHCLVAARTLSRYFARDSCEMSIGPENHSRLQSLSCRAFVHGLKIFALSYNKGHSHRNDTRASEIIQGRPAPSNIVSFMTDFISPDQKMWSETIVGRCRAWTDEQLETAGVLALVYGKVSIYGLNNQRFADVVASSLKSGDRKNRCCKPHNSQTSCCRMPVTKVRCSRHVY